MSSAIALKGQVWLVELVCKNFGHSWNKAQAGPLVCALQGRNLVLLNKGRVHEAGLDNTQLSKGCNWIDFWVLAGNINTALEEEIQHILSLGCHPNSLYKNLRSHCHLMMPEATGNIKAVLQTQGQKVSDVKISHPKPGGFELHVKSEQHPTPSVGHCAHSDQNPLPDPLKGCFVPLPAGSHTFNVPKGTATARIKWKYANKASWYGM